MRFDLDREQRELADTVRALLAKRSDGAAVRAAVRQPKGYDEELWTLLCQQVGVAALAVPEEYGGAGFSLVEAHVVLEELGAALTPAPFLGSAILASQALLLARNEAACADLLPGLADGTTVGSLVWVGDDLQWSTERPSLSARQRDGWSVRGTGRLVLEGDTADVLLVVARTETGLGLFRVDPGDAAVHRSPVPAMDLTLRFATVQLEEAPAELLARDFDLETLRDLACVAVSALQVGAMQRCLDMTVAYAKERVQFGRPIGSFQALKHRMADMLVDVETSRSVSWAAAWSAARKDADLATRAATAKAWCSDAFTRVAAETVQIHGGIAITWEHDAQMYFKRAHATSQLFGQPHEHRRRLQAAWL